MQLIRLCGGLNYQVTPLSFLKQAVPDQYLDMHP